MASQENLTKMKREFETKVAQQARRRIYIAKAMETARKQGQENINTHVLTTRLTRIDEYWKLFDTVHSELEEKFQECFSSHPYFTDETWDNTEGLWIQQRSELLIWIDKITTTTDQQKIVVESPAVSHGSSLKRIKVPQFSGRYAEWPSFRDLFVKLVHEHHSLSDTERLHYLIDSLTGEAADLTRGMLMTGDGYKRAWDRLTDRYENQRVLVSAIYNEFARVDKMKGSSVDEFRRIMHGIFAAVDSAQAIGRPMTSNEDFFIHYSIALFDSEARREWERWSQLTRDPPTLDELTKFMEQHLQTLVRLKSTRAPREESNSKRLNSNQSKRVHHANASNDRRGACVACSGDHALRSCKIYLDKKPSERYKLVLSNRVCMNCLGAHLQKNCNSTRACFLCGKGHHTTLHEAPAMQSNQDKAAPPTHVVQSSIANSESTLLATARVLVRDKLGNFARARVLLDPGSNTSLVTEAFVRSLRLSRRRSNIRVHGICGRMMSRGEVVLEIAPRWGGEPILVPAVILPTLPAHAGPPPETTITALHLHGLRLADPDYLKQDPYQILLSVRACSLIWRAGLRSAGPSDPVAQRTSLGWIVWGGDLGVQRRRLQVSHCVAEDQLSAMVERFWEQEEIPAPHVPLTDEEAECERQFLEGHVRRPDGRYVVRLPVREPLPDLTASFYTAAARLTGMERRFNRNVAFKEQYASFLEEYAALGHMSLVSKTDSTARVAYLPHHGVMKQCCDTTKLRVVFNGSARLQSGISLNQQFLVGENLLPPLTDVIMRWRYHRYVFATDIEKMYRQVLVREEDRDLQRILWRHHSSDEVREFRLNTVTYGLACAPFLAMRVLRQLAADEGSRFPGGSKILLNNVYVDDVLAGAATLEEAEMLIHQVIGICDSAGMSLKKWASNTKELLYIIPLQHQQDSNRS